MAAAPEVKRAARRSGLVAGPGRWALTPEGAAVDEAKGIAVIADVHLGYEWARGTGGDCVPAHSLAETLGKLARLFDRVPVSRLIVAGDLVETSAPCRRTAADVQRLLAWLAEREVDPTFLQGNHDPPRRPPWPSTVELGGWTISHGHRPLGAPRNVVGHLHPVLKIGGVTAPCFLFDETTLVVPAFSCNAAGLDMAGAALPESLTGRSLRCVASTGEELLDFGERSALRRLLGRDG